MRVKGWWIVLGVAACSAGEGEPCGKPQDCARGLTCASVLFVCQYPSTIDARASASARANADQLRAIDKKMNELREQVERLERANQATKPRTVCPPGDPLCSDIGE